jgi:hypothetical protein
MPKKVVRRLRRTETNSIEIEETIESSESDPETIPAAPGPTHPHSVPDRQQDVSGERAGATLPAHRLLALLTRPHDLVRRSPRAVVLVVIGIGALCLAMALVAGVLAAADGTPPSQASLTGGFAFVLLMQLGLSIMGTVTPDE